MKSLRFPLAASLLSGMQILSTPALSGSLFEDLNHLNHVVNKNAIVPADGPFNPSNIFSLPKGSSGAVSGASPCIKNSGVFVNERYFAVFNDSTIGLRFVVIGADGKRALVVMQPGEIQSVSLTGSGRVSTDDNSISLNGIKPGGLYRIGASNGKWVMSQM